MASSKLFLSIQPVLDRRRHKSSPIRHSLPVQVPDVSYDFVANNLKTFRALPLYTGIAGITTLLFNRVFSGIAPVVDASSSQSRADVLGIVMSAVLLLTGLQWIAIKAKALVTVVLFKGVIQPGVKPTSALPGDICRKAMTSGQGNYLANLVLYPGRKEFTAFLPEATQGVAVQPVGSQGVLILGTDTVRGLSRLDQAWLAAVAGKLEVLCDGIKMSKTGVGFGASTKAVEAKAPLHHEGTYLYNGGDLKKVEPMVGMPGCQKSRANVIAVCTEDFAKVLAMLLKPKEGVLRSDDRILTDAIISDGSGKQMMRLSGTAQALAWTTWTNLLPANQRSIDEEERYSSAAPSAPLTTTLPTLVGLYSTCEIVRFGIVTHEILTLIREDLESFSAFMGPRVQPTHSRLNPKAHSFVPSNKQRQQQQQQQQSSLPCNTAPALVPHKHEQGYCAPGENAQPHHFQAEAGPHPGSSGGASFLATLQLAYKQQQPRQQQQQQRQARAVSGGKDRLGQSLVAKTG
ncbi:MAG: hypothetical protein WDW38_002686 [Sanguina aurantia]